MKRPLPPVLAVRPGERPAIICPDWCVDSYDDHFNDLGELEGMVIHHSADVDRVSHSRSSYPDNTIDPTDPPTISIELANNITIAEARRLLVALTNAIAEASE